MQTYKLFLDDIRFPHWCLTYKTQFMPSDRKVYSEDWVIARNHQEFVKLIKEKFAQGEFPNLISFDHDLAPEHYSLVDDQDMDLFTPEQLGIEETGNDSAKWLVEFCLENKVSLPVCYVHSANPAGRERIWSSLQGYNKAIKLGL